MHTFDTETTRNALPFERLIPALEQLFVSGCDVPQRHVHTITGPDGTQGTTLIMPAWIPGRYLGIKTVNIFPANAARGLPGLYSTYVLYDATTGAPLAQMDGNEITSRRTAGASALAASRLAQADARRLLVVGTGRVGSLLPEAYCQVLPIEEVTVWGHTMAHAQAMVHRLREMATAARFAPELEAAVRQADIVSCATLSTEPLIRGEWLQPGSHLDLIGSFTPQMREADDACFAGRSLFVDTLEALQKSGDLLGPLARGTFTAADVRGTLADLCRRRVPGRRSGRELTVFKSVGTALEDLAAAVLVYETLCP